MKTMNNTTEQGKAVQKKKASALTFEIVDKHENEVGEVNKELLAARIKASKEIAAAREKQAREVFSEERAIDVSDIASQTEAKLLHSELALAASRAFPKPPEGFDGVHCVDCDAEIPPKRLEHGYFICVQCQTIKEKKGAQMGLKPWQV